MTVERLDWRVLMMPSALMTEESMGVLDAHFSRFAKPKGEMHEDGTYHVDATNPCLNCGARKCGFQWGLVTGAGDCRSCGWPARANHFLYDGQGNEVLSVHNVVLQYHPDFVEQTQRGFRVKL